MTSKEQQLQKFAFITGGGSGIGLASAQALIEAGVHVTLAGRSLERLKSSASALDSELTSVHALDVTDESQVVQAFEQHTPDVIVVSAGVAPTPVAFVDSTTEDFRSTLATNLDGAYYTIREGAKAMIRGGRGGSIIVISSLAAVEGAPYNQAYAAAKAGVLAIANGAAVELARHNIRVNTILPGWIATEMSAGNQESENFTKRVISRVPMRRWGQPEEIAGAVAYLASDASRYQTGSTMTVDGGYQIF